MWMIGNTLSLFPIIMTIMMFKSPFASLFAYKVTFTKLEGSHHLLQVSHSLWLDLFSKTLHCVDHEIDEKGVFPVCLFYLNGLLFQN